MEILNSGLTVETIVSWNTRFEVVALLVLRHSLRPTSFDTGNEFELSLHLLGSH